MYCLFHSVLGLLSPMTSFDFVKASVYLVWRWKRFRYWRRTIRQNVISMFEKYISYSILFTPSQNEFNRNKLFPVFYSFHKMPVCHFDPQDLRMTPLYKCSSSLVFFACFAVEEFWVTVAHVAGLIVSFARCIMIRFRCLFCLTAVFFWPCCSFK